MAFIVEMARGKPNTLQFGYYSCSRDAWEQLLAIASAYGCKPAGTVPAPLASRREDYEKFFKPNYDPDEWAYCKCISDTDAKNLSTSLAKAVIAIRNGDAILPLRPTQTVIGDDLSVDDMTRINIPDEVLVSKFVEFTAQGGFAFAWDD